MNWTITVTSEAPVKELEDSFYLGPMVDDRGRRSLTEAEIARIGGLKIEVFSLEHPPPHFRVSFQGETANYRITDCVQLNGGLSRYFRNVRAWHKKHKQLLIDEWNSRRPTHCPVGRYEESN